MQPGLLLPKKALLVPKSNLLKIQDVFATSLYTGNDPTGQTITNGVDLAGKGGLVWIKGRSSAFSNILTDTVRGATKHSFTNGTGVEVTSSAGDITSFNSNGFSLGAITNVDVNDSGVTFASWSFAKAAKFFDVVTYTGDGVAGRTIAHNLGVAPGMIVVKCRSNAGTNWFVYHLGAPGKYGLLNDTGAFSADSGAIFADGVSSPVAPTSTSFTISNNIQVNGAGRTYVAYLFAHDTGTNGLVQCGSVTIPSTGDGVAILGWEPQYILWKNIGTGNWRIADSARSLLAAGNESVLIANATAAEDSSFDFLVPSSTGFTVNVAAENPNQTFIYLAIRKGPM